MKVEILSIGNEVVYGDIINSNAAWLSEQLILNGFQVVQHLTIADDEAQMRKAFLEAQGRSDVVLSTGGLGPTVDDFTVEVAAKTFQMPLIQNQEVMQQLRSFYTARNRPLTPNREKQALVPEGAEIYPNPVGSAPGVRAEYQKVNYFFMPGVPKEMKEIFQDFILPWLKQHRNPPEYFASKVLRCFGAEEAKLDELIQPHLKDRVQLGHCQLAFRLAFPEIFIKITNRGDSFEQAQRELEQAVAPVREAIRSYLYAEDDQSLEQTLGALLKEKALTLAVAESCTGGFIAHRITNVSGSSDFFLGGITAYSNEWKQTLLGVRAETLHQFGAVSSETAIEMAQGLRKKMKCDIAVAVTGIAGPGGGSPEKPVGTFHIAIATEGGVDEKKFLFPLDRERFKLLVSSVVLDRVRKTLL